MRLWVVVIGRVGVFKEVFLELNLLKDCVNCNDWGYYKCKIIYIVGNLFLIVILVFVFMDLVGRYMNIIGNVFVSMFYIEIEIL